MKSIIPAGAVESRILFVRGLRVMLSGDLAGLYGVTVRALVQAVKRNDARFPADFMFQLTWEEARSLRSQFVILDRGRGRHRKYRPYAFTEQGVAMLSGVLHSQRAVRVNVEIMRAFVRLRAAASTHHQLTEKLDELERVVGSHDQSIRAVFIALKQLMSPPYRRKRRIGFLVRDRNALTPWRPGALEKRGRSGKCAGRSTPPSAYGNVGSRCMSSCSRPPARVPSRASPSPIGTGWSPNMRAGGSWSSVIGLDRW